jgi:NAD(P)-dependent dehydrogenase (short-subunit alcohol dehydrogenase family)
MAMGRIHGAAPKGGETVMDRRLEKRSILVTGAAGGIGRATAERLAAEGARLTLADRDATGLKAAAHAIAHSEQEPAIIEYDAADYEASAKIVDHAIAAHGRLDAVCNVAGIFAKSHFAEIRAEDWDRMLRINLSSVFCIVQRALPSLIQARGSIVNTASIAGINGIAYAAPYAVSKAGIIALTKSLAVEYAASGVRINVICPGGVRTAMGGSPPLPDADPDLAIRRSKLPGFDGLGEPGDIAAAFAYLVSDDARYVSGTVLTVDGAQSLL